MMMVFINFDIFLLSLLQIKNLLWFHVDLAFLRWNQGLFGVVLLTLIECTTSGCAALKLNFNFIV